MRFILSEVRPNPCSRTTHSPPAPRAVTVPAMKTVTKTQQTGSQLLIKGGILVQIQQNIGFPSEQQEQFCSFRRCFQRLLGIGGKTRKIRSCQQFCGQAHIVRSSRPETVMNRLTRMSNAIKIRPNSGSNPFRCNPAVDSTEVN